MLKGFAIPVVGILGVGAAAVGFNYYYASSQEAAHANGAADTPVAAPIATQTAAVVAVETPQATTAPEPTSGKPRVLFFMNPNGRPCQMQDEEFMKVKSSLDAVADLVYIKTTNPSDEEQFYRYGIRSLPSLIILDGKGSEYKRFPPGIQDPNSVLAVLKELK
jgi:thioredoxin 1